MHKGNGLPDPSNAKSADRVLRILVYLAGKPRPVPAMAVAKACGLPKSTTYHILAVMRKRNFVTYYPDERRWGLGLAAFEIGSAYLRSEPLERLGRPIITALAHDVHEVTHLAVLHGGDVMYLSRECPDGCSPRLVLDVGVRVPAHLTAVGRAILMHLNRAQLSAVYPVERPLTGRLGQSTYLRSHLEAELAECRARGYAYEDGLITPGVSCIAAPVFSYENYPLAAISVAFYSAHRDEAQRALIAEAVSDAARQLSKSLRWRDATADELPA
jgi:DNA-binding IclR family transcriptional regulator